ncbi:MAG: hypothetical protein ACFFCQ_14760 [Promethearchaeota archaeon]
MTIELKIEVAVDLIASKLQRTQSLISEILTRWNETSTGSFLQKARMELILIVKMMQLTYVSSY